MALEYPQTSPQTSASSSPSGSKVAEVEPIQLKGSSMPSSDSSVGPLTPRGTDDLTPRTAAQGTQLLTPRGAEAAKKGAEEANQKLRQKYGVSNNEGATWAVHIIETKNNTDESTALEVVFDWIGGTSTFGAMTGQGFLAVLLMDQIIEEFADPYLSPYFTIKAIKYTTYGVRIALDLAAGVGASEGKRILVRSFNESTFKSLAHAKYWRETFIDAKWQKRDVAFFTINSAHTLVASSVFAYIAHLGCIGINQLLARYNNFLTNMVAEIVISRPAQSFFMGTSGVSNLLGFPFIHKGGMAIIGEGVNYVINDPSLKNYRRHLRTDIRNVQNHWRETYGKKDDAPKILEAFLHLLKNNPFAWGFLAGNAEGQRFVLDDINLNYKQYTKIFKMLLRVISDEKKSADFTDKVKTEILNLIIQYYEEEATLVLLKLFEGVNPKTLAAFSDSDTTRMLINIRNLSNQITKNKIAAGKAPFSLRTEEQWTLFLLKHGVSTLATGATIAGLENFVDMAAGAAQFYHLSAVEVLFQIMCYTSMILLALGVYRATMNLFESLFERNRPISFYSKLYEFTWLSLITMLLLIGGFPNAAQSQIAGQARVLTLLAIIASENIEFSPFTSLIFEKKIAEECVKTPAKHVAIMVDRHLDNLEAKVSATDAKELNSLKTILPPRIASVAVPVSSPTVPAASSERTPLLQDVRALPVHASPTQQNTTNTTTEIRDFRSRCPKVIVGLSNMIFGENEANKPKWKVEDVAAALNEEAQLDAARIPESSTMALN